MRKLTVSLIISCAFNFILSAQNDSLPSKWKSIGWRIGTAIGADYVFPTNPYLKGNYPGGKNINSDFSAHLRGDFSFNPKSGIGRLYPNLYQGIGID